MLEVTFLGIFAPRAGQRVALAGLIVGFASITWIYFGTSLAWPLYALVGSLMTVAAGFAESYAWAREPEGRS